jgi:Holliday junction resolvase
LSLRELAFKSKNREKTKRNRRGRVLTARESKKIRRRGYRAERQLVKKLRALGFKSVRVPVSAPSSEPLPDVFATKGEYLLAFEIKAPNDDKAYFRKDQVKKLFDFLEMFEAYDRNLAVLVGKFPYKWVFRLVEEVADYVVRKDDKDNIRLNQIGIKD